MSVTVIKNGRLVDGNGGESIVNGALAFEGEKIIFVGREEDLPRFDGETTVLDANGGTILPGFIDTHVHMMLEYEPVEQRLATPFSYNFYKSINYMKNTINAGITSVRDCGGTDAGVKQAVENGLIVGPRIQISVTALTTTGGHGDSWTASGQTVKLLLDEYPGMPNGICDGVESVRKTVREVLRAGADVIKVHSTGGVLSPTDHPEFTQFTIEELKVMVEEAKFRRGIKVMAHAQGAEGIKNAIKAGIHSIEHGIYLDDECIELMLENGTYLVPTLLAPVSVLELAEKAGMPDWGVKKAKEAIEAHKVNMAKAYKAGVKIAMGTDAGVMAHGTNLRELALMTDIGMTPMEAIVSTTKVAAECMGWEDRIGTLEVGKLADIVICSTNPLTDIRSLEDNDNIKVVIQGGKVLKETALPVKATV
ncbi:imidazolonepropionase-like amidohydrolase [Bacillus mesophilus]|uniref:Amidohydrolase family protein n=1 Tax=Bacillus mesophilus TaxID=1808955 RepID=A0A6M0Q8N9_9BACI|nr:amidohydrolase family protein [Bacillus mesophilus]MBM7662016.1 imidazolonepropionase-like amidohydrolase [Bacillus mesophilus]NEY72627.1 amidohydrolase family protein [Bacillus mesophilus]